MINYNYRQVQEKIVDLHKEVKFLFVTALDEFLGLLMSEYTARIVHLDVEGRQHQQQYFLFATNNLKTRNNIIIGSSSTNNNGYNSRNYLAICAFQHIASASFFGDLPLHNYFLPICIRQISLTALVSHNYSDKSKLMRSRTFSNIFDDRTMREDEKHRYGTIRIYQ